MSQEAIEAALLEENRGRCAPPLQEAEVERIARSVGRYAPSEAARPQPILESLDPDAEEDLTFLWNPYIPEEFFFGIAGEEGTAKTLAIIDIISRITNGGEMPDGSAGKLGCVLFLISEDHQRRMLIPRMKAAGVNLDHVRILRTARLEGETRLIELPRDFPVVAQAVDELQQETGQPCRLVHLEPLVDWLEGEINENSYKQVRQALMHVSPLAQRLGCTFGATSHWNKQLQHNRRHRQQGSTAFLSAFRVGFSIYQHPEDQELRVFHPENSRLVPNELIPPLAFRVVGRVGRPRLEWKGIAELPQEPESDRRGGGRRAAVEWLRVRLAGTLGAERAAVVREGEAKGWSESTIDRAATDIGVTRTPVPGSDKNRMLWSLT